MKINFPQRTLNKPSKAKKGNVDRSKPGKIQRAGKQVGTINTSWWK